MDENKYSMEQNLRSDSTGHVPNESGKDPKMDETPICTPRIASRAAGMFVGQTTVGITTALIGTTLLELQIQTGADIELLALLVTWSFLGRMIGSFTVGAIFDRLHPEMQLGLALLLSSLASISIPFTKTYLVVAVLMCVHGVGVGYVSTGHTANCFYLWKEKTGPFLQALLFSYSIGGALGPPMAQPFLTKSCGNASIVNSSSTVTSLMDQASVHRIHAMAINNTVSPMTPELSLTQCLHNTPLTDRYNLHSGVFYPFVFLAIIQAVLSIYFAVLFTLDRCQPIRKTSAMTPTTAMTPHIRSILLLVVLTSAMLFCSIGVETTLNTLLYTYAVKHLGWDTLSANYLATAYWASFSGSRALSIIYAKFLKPELALGVCIGIVFPAFCVLAACSNMHVLVMWLCIPLLGIAMGAQMGNIFLVARNFFNISGRISGICMASLFAGGMLHPALTGYLFEQFDMQWYIYIQVIFSGIMVVMFIVIIVKGRKITTIQLVLEIIEEKQSFNESKD